MGDGDLRVGDVSFLFGLVSLDTTLFFLFSTLDLLSTLPDDDDDDGDFTSRLSLKS